MDSFDVLLTLGHIDRLRVADSVGMKDSVALGISRLRESLTRFAVHDATVRVAVVPSGLVDVARGVLVEQVGHRQVEGLHHGDRVAAGVAVDDDALAVAAWADRQ